MVIEEGSACPPSSPQTGFSDDVPANVRFDGSSGIPTAGSRAAFVVEDGRERVSVPNVLSAPITSASRGKLGDSPYQNSAQKSSFLAQAGSPMQRGSNYNGGSSTSPSVLPMYPVGKYAASSPSPKQSQAISAGSSVSALSYDASPTSVVCGVERNRSGAGPVHIVRGHTQNFAATESSKDLSPKAFSSPDQQYERRKISAMVDVDTYIERMVEVPVEKIVYREILREVPVEVRKEIVVPVEVIKKVETIKEVIKEVPVEIPVEKIVIQEVVKVVEVPVEVPVERERRDAERSAPAPEPASPEPSRWTGLGMRLEQREKSKSISVEEIIPGFAAGESGKIFVGDLVETIDGKNISGWSLEQIKEVTVGRTGSSCTVRIRRGDATFDVELTRTLPAARLGAGDPSDKYQEKVDKYISKSPHHKGEIGEA